MDDNMADARGMMNTTHPEYVLLTAVPHNGCTNFPQCYVIPKLPVSFYCNLLYLTTVLKTPFRALNIYL